MINQSNSLLNLKVIYWCGKKISSLPILPETLEELGCYYNELTSLPKLPHRLHKLFCQNNCLVSLPELPQSLVVLYCSNNQLTSLPILPDRLQTLICYGNCLVSLPILPKNLKDIEIEFNFLGKKHKITNATYYNIIYNKYKTVMLILHHLKLPYDLKRKLIEDHF